MPSLPKIIDNNRKSLLELIKDVASNYNQLSIAVGYWDLLGTQLIFDEIKNYKKIRLLIGRELLIPRHKQFKPEPDYPDKDFFDDLERLQPSPDLKLLVQNIKRLINEGVLEVKVYRKSFLHAKCYIFGDYSSEQAIGIIGSSNFTKNGLTKNTELNALESDHRIVTFQPQTEKQEVGHLFWFDRFWNDTTTEDWNGTFTELLEQSPVGDILFSPYESYIKTLYELYREELEDEDLDKSIKGSHELFDFQIKNVHALVRRLKKYKVAMLSDSVGLGKTYTAIEVIKQYLTGNEGLRRVEIICPKSIKTQWTTELTTQGVVNLTPVTLQNPREMDEKRKLDHIASVSLFVIDESHNLKNRAGKRFDQVINWIRNNPKAHVLLLTATPINNQLNDITNQILLGTRGEASIFKVTAVDKRLKQTVQIDFYQAIENLKKKINQELAKDGTIDYDYIRQIMMPILRHFVVRRTRQGIEKEYGGLKVDGQERSFPMPIPEVRKYKFQKDYSKQLRNIHIEGININDLYKLPPDKIIEHTKDLKHPLNQIQSITTLMDESVLKKMSPIYFVYQIILMLGFLPYRWQMYQSKFYGKTRQQIRELKLTSEERKSLFLQISIYGILRTMFLKRMESSINAVRSSLETYKRKLDMFEQGIKVNKIVSLKDLSNLDEKLGIGDEDFNPEDMELSAEDELDSIDDKKYNVSALYADIEKEKKLIDILDQQLEILGKDDAKIRAITKLLTEINNQSPGKKVLVFSYYADTIEYLKQTLPESCEIINNNNTAFLSSKNREDADSLSGRFSPRSKNYQALIHDNELQYLFSTDILSEGQNLQDCGILINYDLHWNPVRMIQRNGRINRLGSEFSEVYIYNISPESQLEEYLNLVSRLEGKINLIRNTIGTDTPVLDEKENPIEFTDFTKNIYSDDLQKRIDAMEQAEKSADFLLTEDEYVSDLKLFHNNPAFSETYKTKIYTIPSGKWALMPASVFRGNPRPDVLALNSLHKDQKDAFGYAFVGMTREGSSFHAVTNLQALEWLKTSPENNERLGDNITINKKQISDKTATNIEAYLEEEETGAPIGQQANILRIMYDNHFHENELESVRMAFQTTNVLDKEKIKKLVRKIIKAKKESKPYLDMIRNIIAISENTFEQRQKQNMPDQIQSVLFYVKSNE